MVKLQDVVDAMEMGDPEYTAYIDRETGEVCLISGYVVEMVERGDPPDTLPEWQRPEYEWARLLLETDRMVGLPGQFEINEWEIMREFAESQSNPRVAAALSEAIHGTGSFSRFRSSLRDLKVEDEWYEYRDLAFREIAREWCAENSIAFEDE